MNFKCENNGGGGRRPPPPIYFPCYLHFLFIFKGANDEVSNDGAYIQSKNTGLIYPPPTGWEYAGYDERSFDDWYDDNTLRVRGKYL